MNNQKLIFISAYCQNTYQENRIENFVKNQDAGIINPNFNVNIKFNKSLDNKLHNISPKEKDFISNSDEVWILIGSLGSNLPENKLKMYRVEEHSLSLNKPLKYFYLYQSGHNTGKAKDVDRKDIFNQEFHNYLYGELNNRRIK